MTPLGLCINMKLQFISCAFSAFTFPYMSPTESTISPHFALDLSFLILSHCCNHHLQTKDTTIYAVISIFEHFLLPDLMLNILYTSSISIHIFSWEANTIIMHHTIYQKDYRFDSWSGYIQEAMGQCFTLILIFLSLTLFLKNQF